MSNDDFYSSTPYELSLIGEGYVNKVKYDMERQSVVTSVGVNNAINKKKVNLFPKNQEKSKKVTHKEKEATLNYLEGAF